MSNLVVRFVANSLLKAVGFKRLANYAALSIGPKIIDHIVAASTKGVIPMRAIRVLRTSLSYAPIAVIMGTSGTSLVSAVTYYIIIQISESLCMLVVREAVGQSFRCVKYIVRTTVNVLTGNGGSGTKTLEDDWIVLDRLDQVSNSKLKESGENVTSEQMEQVEQYLNSIDIDHEVQQQQEDEKKLTKEQQDQLFNEYIKREMDEFVML
ncbi:hypothetical protein SAMD00019534_095890 [Acytostelium subglobosum LB1]|uniref:hypothetical protein n=1 Tax=Acytostelium subglobosum LB1 TaxID=1410327 RepID=UPI0006448BEB|nr:hypothetical protein SAMD00019534_095890 [Acytostelium subglobosum LB1]GAM26414.1 hypothetical protein SAMD00019534_095890 [Acytostelium subglobosum LB1]|eukprot:XP_012750510.1 hypothetical protein SAMD00019534_095890 [Acytostelium subglobosum LB1]